MDARYQDVQYEFKSRGLVARWAKDSLPEQTYLTMKNMEVRQEGAISTRYGFTPITVDDVGKVNTPVPVGIKALGLVGGMRYAVGLDGGIYARYKALGNGAYAQINAANPTSGNKAVVLSYRPTFSSRAYAYFADRAAMLKHDTIIGSSAQRWGIDPPLAPLTTSLARSNGSTSNTELFESLTGFVFSSVTATALTAMVNTTMTTAVPGAGVTTVTPASMANIIPGVILVCQDNSEQVVVIETTATTFTAEFQGAHAIGTVLLDQGVIGTVAANTTGTITKPKVLDFAPVGSEDNDLITFFVKVSALANLVQFKLMLDVGDGTFTDYFWKAYTPSPTQATISGTMPAAQAYANDVYAKAATIVDTRQVGVIPSNQAPPTDGGGGDTGGGGGAGPVTISPGTGWQILQCRRGEFQGVGQAGIPGKSWGNINTIRFEIQTTIDGAVTIAFNDLWLQGGAGLDSFGGVGYDYRYTYYNSLTDDEGPPSITQIDSKLLFPRRQGIRVAWTPSTDPQVTHVRIYRRGGTIPLGWNLVAQVPNLNTPYIDTVDDIYANQQKQLEIDNFPPITTASLFDDTCGGSMSAGTMATFTPAQGVSGLKVAQRITVGTGSVEEDSYIASIGASTFTAYVQFAHSAGDAVHSETTPNQGVDIAAVAFDRVFLAGDPVNPNRLYYSKVGRPSAFPPNNYIEIGTPSDPIQGLIELGGFLYAFTLETIYRIISVNGSSPYPVKTASRHGLFGKQALVAGEGVIFYQSFDGIYAFTGGQSEEVSMGLQWLFRGETLGPLLPMNMNYRDQTLMSYDKGEVFIAYTDTSLARNRIIYSQRDNRWRNDDVWCEAMCYEADTAQLVIADNTGMVYRDRVGDSDVMGYAGGNPAVNSIDFVLETAALNQGSPNYEKSYNEFIADLGTNNQQVVVEALFDNSTVALNLGTVITVNRDQVPLAINSGLGRISRNMGMRFSGQALSVVNIFEAAFKFAPDSEKRVSFDSYWCKYGSDEYKIAKQAWIEYAGASSITLSCYLDGATSAAFSVTLPASTTRTSYLLKFQPKKAKMYRWVATSTTAFSLYNESQIEVKMLCGDKGYERMKLAA